MIRLPLLCRASCLFSQGKAKQLTQSTGECMSTLIITRLSSAHSQSYPSFITMNNKEYKTDDWTNITPKIQSQMDRKLHNYANHPLNLIKRKLQSFFYTKYVNRVGNPLYTVVDNLDPVVTKYQNFDSLLVPKNHVSRSPKDSYYVNQSHMLRAHTSAHQEELMKMGLNKFLVVGDVYRRDAIDKTHYPIFHQTEGVCLYTKEELFAHQRDTRALRFFDEGGIRTDHKQETHSIETVKLLEHYLKQTLLDLTFSLFGKELEYKWVDCYFPFTHPSWELEIMHEGEWLEVLGCGIMEQQLLVNAGAEQKVGWAFGLGLDRLAMKLYSIPDIRLLWSEDRRFLDQFDVKNLDQQITFKSFSNQPPCINDISFWIPSSFEPNDFYDLVRSVGGDTVEEVTLIDEFTHPKKNKTSHCYRIVYRRMDRGLVQEEANEIHKSIEQNAIANFGVELR